MGTSVIPNKLKEELEDVGKVYNSRSGMYVYPNAFSRLQTEIVKVCNVNKELEKENAELKTELTKKADTNHSLVEQLADLESKNTELKEYNKYLKRKRQGGIQKQYNKVAIIKQQDEQLAKANLLLKDVYKVAMGDWNDPKWHDLVLQKAREYFKEIE